MIKYDSWHNVIKVNISRIDIDRLSSFNMFDNFRNGGFDKFNSLCNFDTTLFSMINFIELLKQLLHGL